MSFSGGRRGGTEGPLLWLSVFPCAFVPLDLMSHKVQGSYGKGWAARLFDLFSRISHIRTLLLLFWFRFRFAPVPVHTGSG